VTEEKVPVVAQTRGEERPRRREPDAANEAAILDYVMLDFAEDTLDTGKDPRRGATAEPWLPY
jgi:hypothetical protein